MAGKCKEMSKIKQVIRLYKDGMSKRAIGRELGLYKSTVNKYVGLAEADPLSLDELLKLEDPVLEKRLTGGNPAYSDRNLEIMCMIDRHQGNLSDEELQHGWLANKALILRKNFARIKKVVVVRPRFTNWLMLYAA